VIETLRIEVVVTPLMFFPVPLKVCTPVDVVEKVVALFIRLPPKLKVFPGVVSFHTAPLLSVTSPVNTFAREVVLKLIVPEIFVAPFTVKSWDVVSETPLLMDNDATVIATSPVTAFAMVTSSAAAGTPRAPVHPPPAHVAAALQAPSAVEVQAAARADVAGKAVTASAATISAAMNLYPKTEVKILIFIQILLALLQKPCMLFTRMNSMLLYSFISKLMDSRIAIH
jgi:hypothetical protein